MSPDRSPNSPIPASWSTATSTSRSSISLGPDLRVTPKLALSWDNPKPTLWRFKLRPNVVWHDGTPFTAEDVRFTLEEGKKPTSVKSRFLARVQKVEASTR